MITMIDDKPYDIQGAYKREIIGITKTRLGPCFTRKGLTLNNGKTGKECRVLIASVDITGEALDYITKNIYKF